MTHVSFVTAGERMLTATSTGGQPWNLGTAKRQRLAEACAGMRDEVHAQADRHAEQAGGAPGRCSQAGTTPRDTEGGSTMRNRSLGVLVCRPGVAGRPAPLRLTSTVQANSSKSSKSCPNHSFQQGIKEHIGPQAYHSAGVPPIYRRILQDHFAHPFWITTCQLLWMKSKPANAGW